MICTTCNETKPDEQFVFRNKAKGIRKSRCKECQKRLSKAHYAANKHDYIEKAKRNKTTQIAKNREFVNSIKKNPCKQCGGRFAVEAMEFDHIKDKAENVSHLVKDGVSIRRIKEEIAKCDLVCVNCHRIRTYERRKVSRSITKAGVQ